MSLVLARDPLRAAAYQQRGVALAALGQHDKALADLARSTQLDPHSPDAWRELGTLHYFRGEPAAAVKASSHCLELVPQDGLAANNRGCALLLLGRFSEAEADLVRTMELYPQFASAQKNLAWLRATCPDEGHRSGPLAVELARRALDMIQWDQPEWLQVLAAAEAEAGNFAAAAAWQEKAIAATTTGIDSPAHRRLRLYQSQQPFRHVVQDAGSVELIPGGRTVPLQEIISRA
jgi:tetratricopeptide (TPR) repeat protein